MNGVDKVYVSGLISRVHELESELKGVRKSQRKQRNSKGLHLGELLKGNKLDKIANFFERVFPWLIIALMVYLAFKEKK